MPFRQRIRRGGAPDEVKGIGIVRPAVESVRLIRRAAGVRKQKEAARMFDFLYAADESSVRTRSRLPEILIVPVIGVSS